MQALDKVRWRPRPGPHSRADDEEHDLPVIINVLFGDLIGATLAAATALTGRITDPNEVVS